MSTAAISRALMPVVLAGLDETVLKDYRHTYQDYARYRRLKDGEAALRDLIAKSYARAKKLLDGYLADLREQGLSEGYIDCQKSHLIMAVDMAQREGMTTLNFPRRRDSKPSQSEELLPVVAKDLTAIGERNLRSGLRDYARYRRLKDGEAALRELITKSYAQAKKLVEGYIEDMGNRPRPLADATIAERVSFLVSSVDKLRIEGKTALVLDIDRPRVVRKVGAEAARKTGVTESDWNRIFDQAVKEASSRKGNAKLPALVLLLRTCKPSPSQLVATDLADVDLDGSTILIGGQPIPLDRLTCGHLSTLIAIRREWSGALFTGGKGTRGRKRLTTTGLWHLITKLAVRAGVEYPVAPSDLLIVRPETVPSPSESLDVAVNVKGVAPPELAAAVAELARERKPSSKRVLDTLFVAGPEGLSGKQLVKKSGVGSATKLARNMKNHPLLGEFIHLPTSTRVGKYRFTWPFTWTHTITKHYREVT